MAETIFSPSPWEWRLLINLGSLRFHSRMTGPKISRVDLLTRFWLCNKGHGAYVTMVWLLSDAGCPLVNLVLGASRP
jgi:hypothetical protein